MTKNFNGKKRKQMSRKPVGRSEGAGRVRQPVSSRAKSTRAELDRLHKKVKKLEERAGYAVQQRNTLAAQLNGLLVMLQQLQGQGSVLEAAILAKKVITPEEHVKLVELVTGNKVPDGEPPTTSMVLDMIGLVEDLSLADDLYTRSYMEGLIDCWSESELNAAMEWAGDVHFAASDNDDVTPGPRPACVSAFLTRIGVHK